MTPNDWIQIGLFVAGVGVHFLYTKLVVNGATGAAAADSVPNPNEAMQVLAAITHKLIDQQAQPPQPATDPQAELLSLLHKVIDQKTLPSSTAVTPATTSTTH